MWYFFHYIGKAVDQETEGHHVIIGANLCQKLGESEDIVEAIRNHHNETLSHATPLTVVLHAANIPVGKLPGARRETLETYVKRLTEIEELVSSFDDIESSFVIQAGREIRALIKPSGSI